MVRIPSYITGIYELRKYICNLKGRSNLGLNRNSCRCDCGFSKSASGFIGMYC